MKMFCFGLLVFMVCQEGEAPPAVDTFCQEARIISPQAEDDIQTLRQVREHNAKVRACRNEGGGSPWLTTR